MNKYLQRFSASFIFALALASPQLSYASDDASPFKNFLKAVRGRIFKDVILASPQLSYASDDASPFNSLPKDVRKIIFQDVIIDCIEEGKSFNAISRVNKQWAQDFRAFVAQNMQPWQPCWKAYLGVTPKNEQIYRAFFNGTLKCREDPSDNYPAYILPLLPLMNLSVRSLNLPADMNSSKYVLITDKLQRFLEVGGSKFHILIATKAMISQRMKSMKMSDELKVQLNEMMNKWDESVAPAGIFWRWSDDKNLTWFDCLITRDLFAISQENLFDNWRMGYRYTKFSAQGWRAYCGVVAMHSFMFRFKHT